MLFVDGNASGFSLSCSLSRKLALMSRTVAKDEEEAAAVFLFHWCVNFSEHPAATTATPSNGEMTK